jgi:nitrite reductase/ring-hydroxylating ferredoxin subunit
MAPQRVEIGIHSMEDGTMQEVGFPNADSEGKILLSKVKGSYYATSSTCTHYGAVSLGVRRL